MIPERKSNSFNKILPPCDSDVGVFTLTANGFTLTQMPIDYLSETANPLDPNFGWQYHDMSDAEKPHVKILKDTIIGRMAIAQYHNSETGLLDYKVILPKSIMIAIPLTLIPKLAVLPVLFNFDIDSITRATEAVIKDRFWNSIMRNTN